MRQSAEVGDVLWQQTGGLSAGWEVAEVTVSSPTKFNVKAFVFFSDNQTVLFFQYVSFCIFLYLLWEFYLKQLCCLIRWCLRLFMCMARIPQWKLMTFLWGTEPVVLWVAVTLSLDNAPGSTSSKKTDMTGCWPEEASTVHQQTTPLKPRRVWP